jgi:GNAT superfamily N-acetyltransferase
MLDDIVVRSARPSDAEVIARHRAEMFSDMGQLPASLYQELVDRSVEYLRTAIESGEYVGWLASIEGSDDVIAGAGVQLRRILPRPVTFDGQSRIVEGREAIVLNVFTEQPWRGKGLARRLMQHVLEWAGRSALDRLVLHASDQGRALYDRLGFVPTNEMRYARPFDAPPFGNRK